MKQFKASYILDVIANQILTFENSKEDKYDVDILKIRGLLKQLSAFDVDGECFKNQFDYKNLNPILSTVNNIITRGLPTKAPVNIEQELATVIGVTQRNSNKKSEINFIESNYKIEVETIFELLHLVYPKLNIEREKYIGKLANGGEWKFINETLYKTPFVKQILQSQRPFNTINPILTNGRTVDFTYEIPYFYKSNVTENDGSVVFEKFTTKGVIFEFDGQQHHLHTIKTYDNYRDEQAADANFDTLRQPSETREINPQIEKQFRQEIWKLFEKNYNRNIEEWLKEFILIFTPIAVARIQKTLIEYFLRNENDLKKEQISIAIIERDVPCAELAINSFAEIFINLKQLITEKFHLPKFSLTVFQNSDFSKFDLNNDCKKGVNFNEEEFDIILDISVLFRSNIYDDRQYKSSKKITIRSSHYFDNSFGNARRVYCSKPLHYKPLVYKESDGTYKPNELEKHIEFFIQNIFRKPSFREGQLPIISRALQLLPVIGLLPTGGGKSLTFQLSALMQPGVCIVVDPIKSLMEDQVRVLKNNWIDCCDYLNSNITTTIRRNKLYHLRFGESQLMFLSPERFVIDEFRKLVRGINSLFDLSITYCVIDEVHCVSEWGQNFRDTYLFLGRNAQEFCFTKNHTENKKVSLVGLTATASYDVLADVERELKIEHSDIANALIMTENTIRPEMFFRVVKENNLPKSTALNNDIENIGANLQYWNNEELIEKSIKHHIEEFNKDEKIADDGLLINKDLSSTTQNEHCAIVFCATKSDFEKKSINSVCEVYTNLTSDNKGYYFGSDKSEDYINAEVQKHFNEFVKFNSSLKHIVATKAFGMGIDKEDVRTVYHINYSNSLEAFVQEAGRAGRDKKISESVVFLNSQSVFSISPNIFSKENYNKPENVFLRNVDYRKKIRWDFQHSKFGLKANSKDELILKINEKNLVPPTHEDKIRIKDFLKLNIDERSADRGIQDFFYKENFKGKTKEQWQIHDLISSNQEIERQESLQERFNTCGVGNFSLTILNEKKYINEIIYLLDLTNNSAIKKDVQQSIDWSYDYFDLLLQLEEKQLIRLPIDREKEAKLKKLYLRERSSAETGKLIYRMSCMGVLKDYTIDYISKQRICVFVKAEIEFYIEKITKYLERYLSEKTTIEEIDKLQKRLENKTSTIDKIAECLYFLTEFSYKEVAAKQERALDEIEKLMIESVVVNDKYEQNIYIKEFIYFYFNAKYARPDYKIKGVEFSLLNDSEIGKKSTWNIVKKYTQEVLEKDTGTQNNNYKHLIGSCRKITRGMASTELNKEWSLKLINAYGLYCINAPSYTNNGNDSFYEGLKIFFNTDYCKTNYITFKKYFDEFVESLEAHIDNESFWDNTNIVLNNVVLDDVLIKTNNLIDNHKKRMQQ